ncbi:MAG: hypothetical protein ACRC28_15595 [Clostridium sp.]|uniref:hypothetical protein n=1 Tax=Clostridium sp. TaxID=1506 RepID=UPI003F3B0D16
MVLLVVDTQKLLVNEKLYNFEGFVSNIEALIEKSRENNIQHIWQRFLQINVNRWGRNCH